ncbi:hypothetical protein Pan258_36590 [Symmachiella dynata]|uniref:Uncharacterized protein n=1 Tax=Symmachiella dynata TaxID=2527995 RepID=A0A517ZS41_9PLAN|nr:hypothetical protein [Symmachiella dynata]QDT49605.1 hypothetical protein Pan258_36590 [Symmachiella dynata]QDU45309.1 hypothetical protein Mal52_38020 [Symmachiella dynata]
MTEPDAAAAPDGPTNEELKRALKAFKKRLKLTRTDDEARLGYGGMTSGRKSAITGITPPNQYPPAVWQELVKRGKLKHIGQGLYELVPV